MATRAAIDSGLPQTARPAPAKTPAKDKALIGFPQPDHPTENRKMFNSSPTPAPSQTRTLLIQDNKEKQDPSMATRRRKTRRLRASRCHGWGRSGQHRDSGMQGGHGNAGWKRHRWSSVIRYGWQIGKTGFTPVNPKNQKTINLGDLDLELDSLTSEGKTKQARDKIEINLGELGYTKLLGNGKITRPLRIIVAQCSERAAAKISQAGGQVILPQTGEPVKEG